MSTFQNHSVELKRLRMNAQQQRDINVATPGSLSMSGRRNRCSLKPL